MTVGSGAVGFLGICCGVITHFVPNANTTSTRQCACAKAVAYFNLDLTCGQVVDRLLRVM
jgi:hypothetical protein